MAEREPVDFIRTRALNECEMSSEEVSRIEGKPCPEDIPKCLSAGAAALDDWLDQIDESFSEMVLRKIKEKGMTNDESRYGSVSQQ